MIEFFFLYFIAGIAVTVWFLALIGKPRHLTGWAFTFGVMPLIWPLVLYAIIGESWR